MVYIYKLPYLKERGEEYICCLLRQSQSDGKQEKYEDEGENLERGQQLEFGGGGGHIIILYFEPALYPEGSQSAFQNLTK